MNDQQIETRMLIASTVVERKGKKYWTEIGVAFEHKDGHGFNIELVALPVNGKIVLRPKPVKDDETVAENEAE